MREEYQTPFLINNKAQKFISLNYRLIENKSKSCVIEIVKKLWKQVQFDEWTFTLFLFIFSLSILLGKLSFNHDFISLMDTNIYEVIDPINNGCYILLYDIANKAFAQTCNRYNYLFKATFSGLVTIGITWFIIYKDSTVPGINPPSPFSPLKGRTTESQSLQINYFVGFLNGLCIFCYMCV